MLSTIWCSLFLLNAALGNPIVSVMQRRRFNKPYAHISNAVIISEGFVMTTIYPISLFPTPLLCVLVNMKTGISQREVIDNCIQVTNVHMIRSSKPLDFTVLELLGKIEFTVGITKAVFRLRPPSFTSNIVLCDITVNKRDEDFNIYDTYVGMNVSTLAMYKFYIVVNFTTPYRTVLCPFDNGLPLICQSHVVGLLAEMNGQYCEEVHVYNCIRKCRVIEGKKHIQLRYVNLVHPTVSQLHQKLKLDWWKGSKTIFD